jgi:hypothetical protein
MRGRRKIEAFTAHALSVEDRERDTLALYNDGLETEYAFLSGALIEVLFERRRATVVGGHVNRHNNTKMA